VIDTDANTNQVGYAEVEGRPFCTVAGIKGTFGIALNGTPLLIDPVAIGGQVKLDGLGNITGSETASYNGKITKNSPIYRNLLHQRRLHRNRRPHRQELADPESKLDRGQWRKRIGCDRNRFQHRSLRRFAALIGKREWHEEAGTYAMVPAPL